MKIIKISDLALFPKDEWDYTDINNPIKTYEAPYKFHIYAQKYKGDEVIGYVSGDLTAFENANIPYTEYDGRSGFCDTTNGKTVDVKYLKTKYQNQEIAKGCVTSVMDAEGNPIVMQCGKDDIVLLTNSPLRTMVQDINNVVHQVTEAQFDTILNEIRLRGLQIWQESQNV